MMATKPYTVVLSKNSSHTFGMYIGEDVPSGIYIVTTEINSPAANANIQPGDRVLAVNGQLVSSMYKNPRETITEIAKQAESLTLSIEPSNILQNIDLLPKTNFSNTSFRYISKETNGIDHELENYIKALLGNQNLQIVPSSSSSSNHNEYILTYPRSSRRRHHHHRKRPPVQPIQTQPPSNIDGPKETSPLRSVPSMGTSHALLRNSQLFSKDGGINESPNIPSAYNVPSSSFPPPPPPQVFNFPPQSSNNPVNTQGNVPLMAAPFQKYFDPPPPPQQQPPPPPPPQSSNNPVNTQENVPLMAAPFQKYFSSPPPPQSSYHPVNNHVNLPPPPPINNEGFREIFLRRRHDFEGFGFHLQYNKVYYIINQVEPNSPAEQNGLHPNDIICKVNNQSTDKMSHKTFVQIVHESTEIILLVQSYADYIHANPQALQKPNNAPMTEPMVDNNKKDDDKRQNPFSKALTKLTSR